VPILVAFFATGWAFPWAILFNRGFIVCRINPHLDLPWKSGAAAPRKGFKIDEGFSRRGTLRVNSKSAKIARRYFPEMIIRKLFV
jgi:hypothetical protein